jgi:hypothetical protein
MAGIKACVICLASLVHLSAQTPDNMPSRGLIPTGLFAVSDVETINVVNGNVLFRIPLAALPPNRSGLTAGFNLTYNSQIYDIQRDPGVSQITGLPTTFQHLRPSQQGGGWQYGYMYSLSLDILPGLGTNCNGTPDLRKIYRLSVISPDGSHHTLHLYPDTPRSPAGPSLLDNNGDGYYEVDPSGHTPLCPSPPDSSGNPVGDLTYYTTDGSYLKVVVSQSADVNWTNHQWTIYFPDGSTATGFGAQMMQRTDRNNNSISVQNVLVQNPDGSQDTLSTAIWDNFARRILIQYNRSAGTSNQDTVTQTGFAENGVAHPLTWTVYWGVVSLSASPLGYTCSLVGDSCYVANENIKQRVVNVISLPTPEDNSTHTF